MSTFDVVRTSEFTGREGTMAFPSELAGHIALWLTDDPYTRPKVGDVFPMLDADHREFLLTGCTPQEWTEIFPDGDE